MKESQANCSISAILLYHRIGFPKLSSLVAGQYVAPRLFESQLDYLSTREWGGVTLGEMASLCGKKQNDDKNKVCITFDDGYLSVFEHAYPALKSRNIPATVFVVLDTIDGVNEWDRIQGDYCETMMSANQVREMSDNGFEIGSHTLTHPHLTDLDDEQLTSEIVDSKHKLEDIIGKEVVSFSYPYGDLNEKVIQFVIDAGYQYAVGTKLGIVTQSSNEFKIPRVNIRWNAIGPIMMKKINRAKKASNVL